MNLDARIETILFWKGETVSIKRLAEILKVTEAEVEEGLLTLEEKLKGRGVALLRLGDSVQLGTAAEMSTVIESLTKEELIRDLGRAGLETLTIILYKGPIARSEIDYIRGVNSQFILRNLLVRGLIERVPNPVDERSFLHKPTLDLLQHLGIAKLEDLPEFEVMRKNLEKIHEDAA